MIRPANKHRSPDIEELMNNAITKLGGELYMLNTRNGQQSISIEVASMMSITELEAILHYSYVTDIDFEADVAAFDSIRNCCIALAEKNPSMHHCAVENKFHDTVI